MELVRVHQNGVHTNHAHGGPMLKFIGGTVGIIFLIGLLVVIGVLSLIF
ncbi:MAG TPA: hypothetical protein VD995_01000 [Azospirillum sp.]|nr:hypothetical protein [Azospirillum sp.]